VSVIGLGFVGLSIALTNAKKRIPTVGVDIEKTKIENLKNGIPGFFEPQLQRYLSEATKGKHVKFTTDLDYALKNTNLSFLCVGTPPTKDGKINLSFLKKALKDIHKILRNLVQLLTLLPLSQNYD